MSKKSDKMHHKPNGSPGIVRVSVCAIALILLPAARLIHAQATSGALPSAPSPATTTLHVYTNLKQVPVLVLTSNYNRMKSVDTSKFRLRLDSGPPFRPTHVRQEGDDPISLAILIDASKPDSDLLPQLSQAISALAPEYLQPQDHVSIYAIDCSFIRSAYNAPANAATLKQAVDNALSPWQLRRKTKQHSVLPCKPSLPLWDSMDNVIDDLTQQSGRRVLLAITDGEDGGSKTLWRQVMRRAQFNSIAVFGLLPTPVIGAERSRGTGGFFKGTSPFLLSTEDKFNQICDLSGGVEVQARYSAVSERLKEFTKIVRERYILEFPRSVNEEAGVHTLDVSYRNRSNLYIVSSGITVPIASDDEKKGANTITEDPSRAPTEGTRRVLLPQQ
jgi:hypothetical protein